MVVFNSPLAAAARLRAASLWMTQPQDRHTVKQYLQELEELAREIDQQAQ